MIQLSIIIINHQFLQILMIINETLKGREMALWEMEERHIMERFQLAEQQLKNKFILKRAHMMTRHTKVAGPG